ncbi:MAG: CaiB/BaiF CoA-transferase family protein [Hoeflea sp.]|uniref:CaiB/BaiF CoA transferase family protein n=1 Tax=Hoeflea sp. TaxID=1940281 RepID=UPI00272F1F6D|nr:CaiB/BaiF CoA-transferase family protein [Hoeflea sp.]MDP2118440.1 CaiB/BaiF CoA-transferase family protein [Hoeflea sp.]
MSKYPLDGVRIIALEQYIAAPYCTMWLADCGAEVIKIERPDGGDPRRNYQPALKSESGESVYGGFVTYNRNKKSVALDLQTVEGRLVYLDLIKSADVVVENLKPGSVDKLGIGYADLSKINPKLIYAAISGYGRTKELDGVYSGLPAFDPVIQAMSGITNLFGEEDGPPEVSPLALGDLFTGVMAGYQILLALFMRERTGVGQYIDAAMYDSLVALNEKSLMLYTFAGKVLSRGRDKYQAPYRTFAVNDGYVALITPNDFIWARFCKALGKEEWITDPKMADGQLRAANTDAWEPFVEQWMTERSSDEVVAALDKFGVPAGKVQTGEDLANCEHLKARKALVEVDDPDVGSLLLARAPVRMSAMGEVRKASAPKLGQHTADVLGDMLGYSEHRIAELKAAGAVA